MSDPESVRMGPAQEDDALVRQIVISFDIPTYIPQAAMREIDSIVQSLCRLKRNTPVGHTHWCSDVGAQMCWSQADAVFLGKPVDPNAPLTGEPTFNEDVLTYGTTCRPLNPGEKQ